MRKANCILSH